MPPSKSTGTGKKTTAKKPAAKAPAKKTTTTAKTPQSVSKAKPAAKSKTAASKTTARPKATASKSKATAAKAKVAEKAAIDLAVAAHETGKFKDALKHYRAHLDKYPKDADSHIAVGEIYLSEEAFDEAAGSFEEAYSLDPRLELGYTLAGLYQKAGYNSKALNLWTALLAKTTTEGERQAVLMNLVQAYLKNGQAETALKLLERESLSLPFQEAIGCMLTNNWPRAVHLLEQPAKPECEDFRHLLLGLVYYATQQISLAINLLKHALQNEASTPETALLLAHAYELNHQHADALALYESLPVKSRDARIHLNMGSIYLQQHQLDDAARCFELAGKNKALALDATYGLAQCAVQQKDWEKAFVSYASVIRQFPSNPDWLYEAGLAAYHAGVYHQAIEYFVNALELVPARGDIFAVLGHACYQVAAYDRAASAYQEAISRGVENAGLYQAFGHALLAQHSFSAAIDAYEKAISYGADAAALDSWLAQARQYSEAA